jgi:two-component sensor histidine kinase
MGVYIHNDGGDGNYYLVSFYPLKSESGINNLILSFRDISEQKRNEMLQKKSSERQRISIEVLELINRKTDSDLIDDILTLIRGKTGIDAVIINLKTGAQFYKFASKSLFDNLKSSVNRTVPESDRSGMSNPVLPGLDDSFCTDIAGDSLFWTNNLIEHYAGNTGKIENSPVIKNFLSCAVIPLKNGSEVTGYFMLLDKREDFFTEELIVFYQGIVESIEIALNRIVYELNLENIIHEKELLLKEVHHRVKNNMQVIISLISLQASRQTDEKLRDILNETQNRVRTMALVHEKLYSSDNFTSININAYIKSLVPMLMTSYRVDKSKVIVEIDALDTFFDLSTAIPLAQLVNEALSNVFKHAFAKGAEGLVKISLSPDAELKSRFILRISDNGVGLPPDTAYPHGGNLGFQLIDALARQLRGRITFSNSEGVSIEVIFSEN